MWLDYIHTIDSQTVKYESQSLVGGEGVALCSLYLPQIIYETNHLKSFNFTNAFDCYKQKCKLATFNLAHPACVSLRPSTLTVRNVRLSGLLITSCNCVYGDFFVNEITKTPLCNILQHY